MMKLKCSADIGDKMLIYMLQLQDTFYLAGSSFTNMAEL